MSRMGIKRAVTVGAASLGMALLAGSADARPPASRAVVKAGEAVEVVTRQGKKTFRFKNAWVIPGVVQRPMVSYVLSRAPVGYAWELPQRSFTKRIVEATRRPTF